MAGSCNWSCREPGSSPISCGCARPFLVDQVEYSPDAVTKHLQQPDLQGHVAALRAALSGLDPFRPAEIEAALREAAEARNLKAAILIHAARVAATGEAVSPSLFDVLALLGRERTMTRLESLERYLECRREPARQKFPSVVEYSRALGPVAAFRKGSPPPLSPLTKGL